MIPKIIHYCWFGGKPLPKLAQRCIASWKKYLPDYEIKEWNESNFDVHCIPYCSEAYKARKYAFVSDYARFKILYEEGGLYFDTDVEIIRNMDHIIARGPFMGRERIIGPNMGDSAGVAPGLGLGVNPGLGLGVNPGLGLYKELLDLYGKLTFLNADGSLNIKTVVDYTTEVLEQHGYDPALEEQQVAGIWIYPKEYFCPFDKKRRLVITERTVSIHHYAGTWISRRLRLKKRVVDLIGKDISYLIMMAKHRLCRGK